jgi:hypothetical protein
MYLPAGEDSKVMSQLTALTMTAPEETVHIGYERALYSLNQAASSMELQISPLGLDIDAADYELRFSLPTAFPHLFTTSSGMSATVSAAACSPGQRRPHLHRLRLRRRLRRGDATPRRIHAEHHRTALSRAHILVCIHGCVAYPTDAHQPCHDRPTT